MPATQLPPADEQQEFLGYIKDGIGPQTAAYALNWTPRQLNAMLADKEFSDAMRQSEDMRNEAVEEMIYKLAMRGNTRMLELWVFNRVPERWAPATQRIKIDKTTSHQVELVGPAKEVALAMLREKGAIAALHEGALDVESRDDAVDE